MTSLTTESPSRGGVADEEMTTTAPLLTTAPLSACESEEAFQCTVAAASNGVSLVVKGDMIASSCGERSGVSREMITT
jgi:hypothetical protein